MMRVLRIATMADGLTLRLLKRTVAPRFVITQETPKGFAGFVPLQDENRVPIVDRAAAVRIFNGHVEFAFQSTSSRTGPRPGPGGRNHSTDSRSGTRPHNRTGARLSII
jgi:hypothetical protein